MNKKTKIIIGLVAVVLIIVAVVSFINHGVESTDDANIDARIITISPKVPGYVTVLHVDDNQVVKQGDVLVEVDPVDYQLRLDVAEANVDSAEVALQNAAVNAKRAVAIGTAAGTQKDIDNAKANEASAQASLDNAKAQLALAEKDLADSKVIAPADGVVTMRSVAGGAYVTTGEQLLMLVGITRWVVANFKETQLTHMAPGQHVDIKVDAYPDLKMHGHVESIQRGTGARFSVFPAENATGNFVKIVQRVPVKIVIDSPIPDYVVLGPGLSVVPTVHIDDKNPVAPEPAAQQRQHIHTAPAGIPPADTVPTEKPQLPGTSPSSDSLLRKE